MSRPLHRETHESDVEGCYACKLAGVQLAASARGKVAAKLGNMTDAQWDRDMPAYKRLRAEGLQPRHIDGAAKVEATAETLSDINPRRYGFAEAVA